MRTKKETLIILKLMLIIYWLGRIFWFFPPIIWILEIHYGFCNFLFIIRANDLIKELRKDLSIDDNGYWYPIYSPLLYFENYSAKPFKLRIKHLEKTIKRIKNEIKVEKNT